MRTDTKPRPIEQACSFDVFLSALNNPAPPFVGAPRTLRDRVAARQFGDFGTVLMAEKPASADLSDRVACWRATEAHDDRPLRAHPEQAADDGSLRFAITVLVFSGWIVIHVMIAAFKGHL